MTEFETLKPTLAAVHWDGKMIKALTGNSQENQAILVSGEPHFLEGKLLNVIKLVDAEGNPTSTGEAQAEAVIEEIRKWNLQEEIIAFVFDTTASNTGVRKGVTVRLQ